MRKKNTKSVHKLLWPSKPDGRIPAFKNYKEEANFWDTHNVTDFADQTENVEIIVDLKKPKAKIVPVRMQEHIWKRLNQIAVKQGINISTLIRMWLFEKLQIAA